MFCEFLTILIFGLLTKRVGVELETTLGQSQFSHSDEV